MHMQWLWWSLRRGMMFPFVWVIVHVTVFLWQAIDSNYVQKATFVADYILKPLHPWIVKIVDVIFPALKTYVGNKPPTYEDAPKVLYPVLMGLVGFTILMVWSSIKRYIFGTQPEMTEAEIRYDEQIQLLARLQKEGRLLPPNRLPPPERPRSGHDSLTDRLGHVRPENQG